MGERSATGGSLGRSLKISLFGAVAVIVTAAFVPLLPATLLPRRAAALIVGTYIATILWLLRNVVGLNWELRGLVRSRLRRGQSMSRARSFTSGCLRRSKVCWLP